MPLEKKQARAKRIQAYARAVTSGKIVAGKPVRLACERHLRDLREGSALGLVWRPEMAEAALDFIEDCLFLDDGVPFRLDDFQAFIVGVLFGWYNAEGFRRFRTAYIEIGKGNGKTPLAAAIGLYGLIVDKEPAPEIYSAATTREQARICFSDAYRMCGQSPDLAEVEQSIASLTIPSRYATFRALSAEKRGLDGKRPHIAVIDELHEHPTATVVDKIRLGTKSRRNALIFEITNSGYDRKSVCFRHHDYSLKVLEGVLRNDTWFAYVCTLDEGDDWRDEKVWLKANPGLGTILPMSYLREQSTEAQQMPSKENIVKRLNFCVWTEQATRWISLANWRACKDPVDADELRGALAYGGLDLSTVYDISALVLAFPDDVGIQLLPFFFVPAENVRRRVERDLVPYDEWIRDGYMIATPGDVIDYDYIRKKINELALIYNIREIAFDRWNSSQLVTQLMGDGVTMVPFGQGFGSMSAPSKEFEKQIIGRKLAHGNHPVLQWMASNVAVERDAADNIKPSKKKSTEKIDGIVSSVMAIGRVIVQPEGDGQSVYASRGMLSV